MRQTSDFENGFVRVRQPGVGMPHAKLLKLMAMPGRQFRELMDTATKASVVSRSLGVGLNYAGDVYFLMDGDV